mgnify:CR=1 FL=1
MRIFEMGFTEEIIVLFDCHEKDVHDTKGNYSFTLVVGKDKNGIEHQFPTSIEITFNEINL